MSEFKVEVKRIVEKRNHPDADKLAIYKVEGVDLPLISGKHHSIGDQVVYCPLDTILPDWLLERIGLLGKLSGSAKNRVKTVKLRGMVSQGLIFPVHEVEDKINPDDTDLTEILGITKYEEPEVVNGDMVMNPLPPDVRYYDIENAHAYKEVFNRWVDDRAIVAITEKLEGTNWSCAVRKDGTVTVHSHKKEVAPGDNVYWEMAEKYEWVPRLQGLLSEFCRDNIVVYGEIIGPKVQGNYYDLPERQLRVFDILVNGQFLNYQYFQKYVRMSNRFAEVIRYEKDLTVPRLYYGDLRMYIGGSTLEDLANGMSVLNEAKLREGLVIKPAQEATDPKLGREILKLRSPKYLLGETK